MRVSIRSSTISRISGAVAGLWLCGAGAAWAGGGADFGSLTALLNDSSTGICNVFHINPCPVVPSITQSALEVAALGNNLSEMLLLQNQFAPASRVKADNPPATASDIPFDSNGNAILPTASTAPSLLSVLSNLTPLAFKSQSLGTATMPGTAPVTQLYDTSADAFLYAVALSSTGTPGSKAPLPLPDYVYFFYDDLFRFNLSFGTGATIAKFTFPLRVLTVSSGVSTERAVPTTLNFVATNAGDCSMSTVSGNFNGNAMGTTQPLTPDKIGISCQVVLSASPASTQTHAIFEVAVPLLVTQATDSLYFYSASTANPVLSNPVNSPLPKQGVYTAFQSDTGHSNSTNLGTGIAIGLAPSAAPLCSDLGVTCLSKPMPATFPICANLPTKNTANSVPLRPAVGAYFAMATSGETLLSAALGTESTSTCSLF